MKFGEKYKKKCIICGKEFEGMIQSKYCSDECRPSKNHGKKPIKAKEETKEEVKVNETKDNDNVNVVGDSGIENPEIQTTDTGTDRQEPKTEVQPNTKNEVNSIQIIDSNTGKKEKGIVDQVLEKLFSDDLAPITTSILGALAAKLQQPNNSVEEGILTAEDGSKHQMI